MQLQSRSWRGIVLASSLTASVAAAADGIAVREMTLDEVLAHAEANAPSLVIAASRASRADAARAAAAPFFPSNPTLEISGGGRMGGGQDGADVSVGVSQELEIAGEPALRREAAERRAGVFEAELALSQFTVHQQVHVSFHAALVAEQAEVGAADALRFAQELLAIAEKQVKAGDASPLAEKLARAEVSRAKEQQLAAQQEARAARLGLALVTGLGGAEVRPKGLLPDPMTTAPLATLLAVARERQPELRLRQAAVAAARAQTELADREAFPKPALGVSSSTEGFAPGLPQTQQIVLGTIALPLPLWRRNDGDRAHSRADLAVAEAEHRAVLLVLENRIAQAKARVDSDAERIALHTNEVLPALDENLQLVQRAFSLGDADITDVMLARERLLSSRRAALDAYRDYFAALAELEAEVGAEVGTDVSAGAEGVHTEGAHHDDR